MTQLFEMLADILDKGEDAVLATVVASSGSAPGGLGARMLVDKTGRRVGTVGGGAVEHAAEQRALEALKARQNVIENYTLRHSQVGDIGMVCGGNVNVYFQFIPGGPQTAGFARKAQACFGRDENAWLLCSLLPQDGGAMALYSKTVGLVPCGGENLFTRLDFEDIKGLLACAPLQREVDGHPLYSEPLVRAGRAVVFGGGHISQALVPLLAMLSFRTVVFEDRPDFADPALFPQANEVILGSFDDIAASLTLTPNDYLIVVTRGHAADLEVQKQILRGPYAYVGGIGSRTKIKAVNERLLQAGISPQALQAVHTPIGLDIGAKTPAEIGISIAAQLIQVRAAHERI